MIFLKLGGSLITDKAGEENAREDVIRRLAQEIAQAYQAAPSLKLLVGHGSGSFGHRAAQLYGTHLGAEDDHEWHGFSEVAAAANRLHRVVLDLFRHEGLPALSFPPSSMLLTRAGQIESYALEPIRTSLEHGLLPVVYGDVAFDHSQGASIVSTEQVLAHLALELNPQRVLLAGMAPGIQTSTGDHLESFTAEDLKTFQFHEPHGADVTGGMRSKVEQALALKAKFPDIEITIFSAEIPNVLRDVLLGDRAGTRILKN